jgi:hypothetical protein
MLLDDPRSAFGITPRAPRDRLDQDLDLACYAQEPEAQQTAEFAHAPIVFATATAARCTHRKPHLVARGQAIDGL